LSVEFGNIVSALELRLVVFLPGFRYFGLVGSGELCKVDVFCTGNTMPKLKFDTIVAVNMFSL